eukprot:15359791-Ditylum_brightwellii.AAC.1
MKEDEVITAKTTGYHQAKFMVNIMSVLDNQTMTTSNKAFTESNCILTKQVTKLQEKYTTLVNIMKE